jgi:hypothetical protein
LSKLPASPAPGHPANYARPASPCFLGSVPIEEISRIAGCTTEIVYRHELRPIITIGVTALDAPPQPLLSPSA